MTDAHDPPDRTPQPDQPAADASPYAPPGEALLRLGRTEILNDPKAWPDYRAAHGLTVGHVPELVRLVRDWRQLWSAVEPGTEDLRPEAYGPTHAWRALGQLRAAGAVGPLLQTLDEMLTDEDEDFSLEEIPTAVGLIGPAALDGLAAFLAEQRREEFARIGAARAVQEIGTNHPDARPLAVGVLTAALERHADNPPGLNGTLVGHLMDLKAVEAVPAIRRAYAADRVDGTVCGNWQHVREALGLSPQPDDPPVKPVREYWRQFHPALAESQELFRRLQEAKGGGGGGPPAAAPRPPDRSVERQRRKDRDKRKAAKQARRQNRKRR